MGFTKAKRGDLVALQFRRTHFVQGARKVVAHESWELAEVAGISREGAVKKVRRAGSSVIVAVDRLTGLQDRRVLPSRALDVQAVLEAYEAREWPSGRGSACPFDSLEEARDFIRPFLHVPA